MRKKRFLSLFKILFKQKNDFLFKKRHKRRGWLTAGLIAVTLALGGCDEVQVKDTENDFTKTQLVEQVSDSNTDALFEESTIFFEEQDILDNSESATDKSLVTKSNDDNADINKSSVDIITIADKDYDVNIEELFLLNTAISNDDIQKLNQFRKLKSLSIDLTLSRTDVIDLGVLSELNTVTSLYINGTYEDFSFINGMNNLESIYIEHFYCDALKNIPKNTTVETINVDESEIIDLAWVENFKNLNTLSFNHFASTDYSAIGELNNLINLTMNIVDKYDIDLEFIRKLSKLEKFTYYPITDTFNIDCLSYCSSIVDLNLFVYVDNFDFCRSMNNLKSFTYYAVNDNIYDLSPLLNCTDLNKVVLDCCCDEESFIELNTALSDCEIVNLRMDKNGDVKYGKIQ